MAISVSGLGSGLDINSLVTQLMSAESRPMSLLKTQQKAVSAKLSAYGQLSSALANLQNSLKGLSSSALAACSASSSSTALSASAGAGAVPGSFAVAVTQLAQSHKLCSPAQASDSTDLGAGTLSISVGGGAPLTLSPATNSLRDLRDAINASGLAVSASIVNDGSGQRLVVAGRTSGAGQSIALTGTGALAAFSYDPAAPVNFAYDAGGLPPAVMSQTQAAQDAQLTVDGIRISSTSNTVSNAIAGVTLQLTQVTTAPATLTVARDTGGVKAAVNSFVKTYNELRTLVGSQTAFNEATRTGAALYGDSGPRAMLSQLRANMTSAVAGAGSLDVLSDIGLSFQKDGSLTLNDAKLQTALDTAPADLQALFAGSDGIATRLGTRIANMLGEKGVLTSRTEGLTTTQRSLSQRETSLQARLDAVEARYRAQFTRLDASLTRMQGTSNYLGQQLAALNNL